MWQRMEMCSQAFLFPGGAGSLAQTFCCFLLFLSPLFKCCKAGKGQSLGLADLGSHLCCSKACVWELRGVYGVDRSACKKWFQSFLDTLGPCFYLCKELVSPVAWAWYPALFLAQRLLHHVRDMMKSVEESSIFSFLLFGLEGCKCF